MASQASLFITLPTELFLEIFSSMACWQIALLRRVNRRLLSIIDEHHDILAPPHVEYHRERLQSRVEHLTNIQYLDPTVAFATYTAQYGITLMHDHMRQLFIRSFTNIYLNPTIGPTPVSTNIFPSGYQQARDFFEKYLQWLYRHEQGTLSALSMAAQDYQAKLWFRAQLTTAAANHFVSRLQDLNSFKEGSWTLVFGIPRYFLTRKFGFSRSSLPAGQGKDYCPYVHMLFGLPELERMGVEATANQKRWLAYCVESRGVAKLARKVEPFEGGQIREDGSEVLSPLQFAGLIKDMSVW